MYISISTYLAHSPAILDKLHYLQVNYKPTTANVSRIGPNQAFFNAVLLQLLGRNNWRRVGILSSLDEFSLVSTYSFINIRTNLATA